MKDPSGGAANRRWLHSHPAGPTPVQQQKQASEAAARSRTRCSHRGRLPAHCSYRLLKRAHQPSL